MQLQDRRANIYRILQILDIINHPIKAQLEQNITLFSNKELFQVIKFLETGQLKTIDDFLEDKKQEYVDLINNLKLEKRYKKLKNIKEAEKLETKWEKLELLETNFNY